MTLFVAVLSVGALVHVIGAALAVRESDARSGLVASAGALLCAGVAVYSLSRGAGPDQSLAATAALAGSLTMLSGHGFRSTRPWPALATSLVGAGLVGGGIWLGSVPPRAFIEAAYRGDAWSTAAGACLLGGLAFFVLSLLLASRDARVGRSAWLALAASCAVALAAALSGASGSLGDGVFWPLVDGGGVPVEIIGEVARGPERVQLLSVPAVATDGAGLLATLIVAVCVCLIAAGTLAALGGSRFRWARGAFGLAALLALATLVPTWTSAGAVAPPDVATMQGTLAAAGASTELLVSPPRLGSESELFVHASAVAPLVLLLWTVAVIGLIGAVAPAPSAAARWSPGDALASARDAAFLGSLLLWVAVALTMLTQLALTDREGGASMGALFAIAALGTATVTAWHAALGRGRARSFAAWLAMPCATLSLAAVAMLSGSLGAAPFTLIFGAP